MLTTEHAGRIVDYFADQDDCEAIQTLPCYATTRLAQPRRLAGWYVTLYIREIGASHGYLVATPEILEKLEATHG